MASVCYVGPFTLDSTPPSIFQQPLSSTNPPGSTVNFAVTVRNIRPVRYQWMKEGVALIEGGRLTGTTNGTLTIGNLQGTDNGSYSVQISNIAGVAFSTAAKLTMLGPPGITSAQAVSGKQGQAFSYTITASNNPTWFGASGLPSGLSINATSGLISGAPLVSSNFVVTITASNVFGMDGKSLAMNISPSVLRITSALVASGTEGVAFTYQIAASDSPTGFGATGLPQGLKLDPTNGLIAGTPVYGGTNTVTLTARNGWGTGVRWR